MIDRGLPRIRLYSPLLWWRYFVRFFASFIPPSPVKAFMYRLTGLKIQKGVFIGESVYFVDGFKGGLIELGKDAVLSPKAVVVAMAVPGNSFLARDYRVSKVGKIVIEDGAWVGAGAVVLPGVSIGRGAIVGANAVVSQDIPPLEVWGGVPAKFIKKVEEYALRN